MLVVDMNKTRYARYSRLRAGAYAGPRYERYRLYGEHTQLHLVKQLPAPHLGCLPSLAVIWLNGRDEFSARVSHRDVRLWWAGYPLWR